MCINQNTFINIISFLMRIVLFIVLLIPLTIIGLLILIIDLTNPIFRQQRVNKNSKLFYIYKFRTMKNDKPTKLGSFLRKTKLDELLQIINLLNYSMNFIGPRPLTISDQMKGEADTEDFKFRLVVKSGITGYQQITSNNPTNEERLEKDIITINNQKVSFKMKILFRTIIPYKEKK